MMERHIGGFGIFGMGSYIHQLRENFNSAIKHWRERYPELNDQEWIESNEIIMRWAGKRP